MRILPLTLLAFVAAAAHAADLRHFDDAALHAVQFCDDREGWAVGDEGVVWHTSDAGKTWERQPTGVRASLRSVHFLNPYVGWAVGREELPAGAGSSGVLLFTRDGGLKWQRIALNAMPGLHKVVFVNPQVGYVLGDGADLYPSGVFVTRDGGRKWEPLPGPRCPGWLAADFIDADNGALVGAWNRLGNVRDNSVSPASVDSLGGRNIRGVHLVKNGSLRGVAVGQGGLVLLSDNAGIKWSYPELRLAPEVLSCWDLHAVHGADGHLWAAGRPGTLLLHSADNGQTWELQHTNQPLPLNGLHFADAKRGWAVGELGTILTTADGGKTWQVQQQGGKRCALLHIHGRPANMPIDCVAQAGGDQGFLTAAVRVFASDCATASFTGVGEAGRWSQAQREAGGASGEVLWQFPLAAHLADASRADVLQAWDRMHGDKAPEQLLRQLVLALRLWRPDVIVTDRATGAPLDVLVTEAVREACKQAGDANAFPEQIGKLGLAPWSPRKLYAVGETGSVVADLTEVSPRLESSVRDFAAPCACLLAEKTVSLPRQRGYQLLSSKDPAQARERSVMDGINGVVGENQRKLANLDAPSAELLRALRQRASVQAIADQPLQGISDPDKLLASIAPMLEQMPDAQGAAAAHALAMAYVRQGEWHLAREAFLLMVERYPVHPLSAEAYRWLIAHNASSETRRRHELGQFMVTQVSGVKIDPEDAKKATQRIVEPKRPGKFDKNDKPEPKGPQIKHVGEAQNWTELAMIKSSAAEVRQWHQGSLDLEPRLAAFGPLFAGDLRSGFCLAAARRNTGDFEGATKWYKDVAAQQPEGPWRSAAAAELWLANRRGTPPKAAASCRQTDTKPFLDGKLDDACWQGARAVTLDNAAGETQKECATKAWLAYDKDFLYFAVRCTQKPGKAVPLVKARSRDADLQGQDRVSLILDLDRDYSTAYRLTIDQRGCVHDECWGDVRWNPRWFVAVSREENTWQAEAAIPLAALSGDTPTIGRAWCCNVVRVLPGDGVQAFSLPAGVPELEARLEGMGLLLFTQDPKPGTTVQSPSLRMDKVPE